MDEGYMRLAIAIVQSAAKEYRQAKKHLYLHPESKAAKSQVSELESFFRSDWCGILCMSDTAGEYILNKLNKEVVSLGCEGIPIASYKTKS